ncbi:flagellar biosynthesis protein FlhA [Sandarakinorhabdus cyanobacteriorum]|uniref:Flagellar biosynthesis protein FlhA n=1 Tax=Sandarakinorhabdus cyanobacteriorum TaxID=1981098 RepID=A0A255Y7K4_9SPHN|nr:flagellar biosynthesis protein FlhA [Sandarakinorhabdus cyanobacteriorum]OYQ25103.1 flagellar biosynthesis protein FlhA [Sandarakinorhabdus cyanobacteriorum]
MTALAARLGRIDARTTLLPLAILVLVALMVVPLPAVLLDLFFITNIAVALIVLMVAINIRQPLDFSAFPTVLLYATLLRLALNVASTRVVLVHGHEGTAAAGHVIEAFGSFLVGGDYVVGLFVFAVLMIINLVVITKGAGRVSEVAARFTLDALPGKQMAIGADLNAGLITADEARLRRAEVTTEADFHGAMDGSSKFVKGDAVAGVLILAINIIGGLILGTVSHDLALGDAARTYLLLAVGDGLVAQVPALLLSIAAAMVVTRVGKDNDLAGQVGVQLGQGAPWLPVGVILALLGLLPGMPLLIIAPAAAAALWFALRKRPAAPVAAATPGEAPAAADAHIDWSDVADSAPAALDIGFGLVPLVDEARGAPLMARITAIRRQLSKQLGFVLPAVRVRDDLSLPPFHYRITLAGVVVGEDEIFPDDVLAIAAGPISTPIPGREAADPAFGLPARWIDPAEADLAEAAGYNVVDPAAVAGTHLNQLLGAHAHRLLGQDEVQALIDTLAETAPALAAALAPKALSVAIITQVLARLVEEGISIRDLRSIAGALIAAAPHTQDPAELAERIRPVLGAAQVQALAGVKGPLTAVALDPGLEGLLVQAVRANPGAAQPFDPALVTRVAEAAASATAPLLADGTRFAIVTVPPVRRALWQLLRARLPQVPVLAFPDIPDDRDVTVAAVIGAAPRTNGDS